MNKSEIELQLPWVFNQIVSSDLIPASTIRALIVDLLDNVPDSYTFTIYKNNVINMEAYREVST